MKTLPIMKNSRMWVAISISIIAVGILFYFIYGGFNLGIDFAGGTQVYAKIGQDFDVDEVRSLFNDQGVEATVMRAGENKQDAIVRIKDSPEVKQQQDKVIEILTDQYGLTTNEFETGYVGTTIGRELYGKAVLSLAIASILMLLYIWIRFELLSGVAAVIALVHDVLIMTTAVLIFRIPINSPFIAALLTIIGYSINDTIVVFDRIRENRKRFLRSLTRDEVVDKSISETMVRSLNTSLTTLFAVTALYVIGVESIKEFTFPILIGIISGTYSSIFIASPIWAWWSNARDRRRKAKMAR
jgi:preprotein translocase subunit SecF